MKIKICGMRDPENIKAVAELMPDMIGFIFYDKSPRSALMLDPKVVKVLPTSINRVGVFVNESPDRIAIIASTYALTHIQLHGDESPDFCHKIAILTSCTIIKATTPQLGSIYDGAANILLFDTPSSQRGGTGKRFNWQETSLYKGTTPWLLSGGITPEHVSEIIEKQPYGIDINSRFEIKPGIKEIELLRKFTDKIRKS